MIVQVKELNGKDPAAPAGQWQEIGTPGLDIFGGYIQEAYHRDLDWPGVYPLYNRLWRSCPEIVIARQFFSTLASDLTISWQIPERSGNRELPPPNDDDLRALEFAYEVSEDIDNGGLAQWLTNALTRVPFFGWGWWEVPLGLRRTNWRAPGGEDEWRSAFNDHRVGFRRLAWRSYASFDSWDIDERSGRVYGLRQLDMPNPLITIPRERSLHLTFGDNDNPEGVATLEAVWRLERVRYALEFIQGAGFEHAAGHVKFSADKKLTEADLALIKKTARGILTAQEGNYIALPAGINADVIDIPFSAAPAILEAIRHYNILILSLLGMQWVALNTMSGSGSYAATSDTSALALSMFNAMAEGLVNQADAQLGDRLFAHPVNAAAFPHMTRRPVMVVNNVEKDVQLGELGQFLQAFQAIFPLSDEDQITIRRKTGFLPETVPEEDQSKQAVNPPSETPPPPMVTPAPDADDADSLPAAEMSADESQFAAFAGASQTLTEKIKTMPDYLRIAVQNSAAEHTRLREAWHGRAETVLGQMPEQQWRQAQEIDETNANTRGS